MKRLLYTSLFIFLYLSNRSGFGQPGDVTYAGCQTSGSASVADANTTVYINTKVSALGLVGDSGAIDSYYAFFGAYSTNDASPFPFKVAHFGLISLSKYVSPGNTLDHSVSAAFALSSRTKATINVINLSVLTTILLRT